MDKIEGMREFGLMILAWLLLAAAWVAFCVVGILYQLILAPVKLIMDHQWVWWWDFLKNTD